MKRISGILLALALLLCLGTAAYAANDDYKM